MILPCCEAWHLTGDVTIDDAPCICISVERVDGPDTYQSYIYNGKRKRSRT